MASRLNLDLGAPKKSAVSLVISGGNEKLLSKEQKRFNSRAPLDSGYFFETDF